MFDVKTRLQPLVVSIAIGTLAACGGGSDGQAPEPDVAAPPPPPDTTPFEDRTDVSGIRFTAGFSGEMGNADVPLILPSGVAAGDYDADGDIDLFIVRGDIGPNILYRNNGNLVFEDVAAAAGIAFTKSPTENYRHSSPAFADLDGDGDLDLILAGLDGDPTLVFANNGDATFADVSAGSGFDQMQAPFSMSTSFGDYDLDGDLDVMFGHWGTFRDYDSDPGDTEHLWRNDSDASGIRFTSVSESSGIAPSIIINSDPLISQRFIDHTFTPTFVRVDDDEYPDILVVSDFNSSQVFINNQDGTFSNSTDYDVIIDGNGMGSAVGDFDGDGDMDWFVSSILAEGTNVPSHLSRIGNRLYRNDDGVFADVTDSAGVADGGWGWGSCFLDFENDGDLDIFHTNGWHDFEEFGEFPTDSSKAFVSNGDGTFEEQGVALGLADTEEGRGIVCADFDNDGDTDILQLHRNETNAATLLVNTASQNYLSVRLRGNAPNTEAIGARIAASVGDQDQLREVTLGSNFASHNPTGRIFGLGTAGQVDTLTVTWPDGQQTIIQQAAANQSLVIDHPDR